MKKIFLAIPTYKTIEPETQATISELFKQNEFKIEYCNRRGSPNIYMQHAGMCNEFLEGDADYYLWFDSDQTIEGTPNWLTLLVNASKPIISPLITRKVYPFNPACWTREQHFDVQQGKKPRYEDYRRHGNAPFKVYSSCGGVVLIKRSVLEAIAEKYVNPFYASFDSRGHQMGVDISLYHKARELGFQCWIHPEIKCGHLGKYAFLPADYYSLLDAGLLEEEFETRC